MAVVAPRATAAGHRWYEYYQNTGTVITTSNTLHANAGSCYIALVVEDPTATPCGAPPTLSGGGLTWTQRSTVTIANGNRRITMFTGGIYQDGSTQAITINLSGGAKYFWIDICEYTSIDLSNPIVQVGTTNDAGGQSTQSNVQLASGSSSNNFMYMAVFNNQGYTITFESGWTHLQDQSVSGNDEWCVGYSPIPDANCIATWAGSARFCAIAAETRYSAYVPPTPVSGSDSGGGSDATSALKAVAQSSDAGSLFSETASIPRIAVFPVDTGAGSDTYSLTLPAAYNVTDAGYGTEVIPTRGIAVLDTATDLETITLVARPPQAFDSGSGTDAVAEQTRATVIDSAAGADATVALVIALSPTADVGVGTETHQLTSQTIIAAEDSGVGAEIVTAFSLVDTDAALGIDVIVAKKAPVADSGLGSEAATQIITPTVADSGSGSDTAQLVAPYDVADNATGADSQVVYIPIFGTQTGVGTETATVTAPYTVSDSGSSSEVITLARTVSDVGSAADILSRLAVAVFDQGAGFEVTAARRFITPDSGSGVSLESVAKTTVVGDNVVATYDLSVLVRTDCIATYRVLHLATGSLTSTFGVRVLVADNLTADYGVIHFVHADIVSRYLVGAFPVNADIVSVYQVFGPVYLVRGIVTMPPRAKAVVKMKARTTPRTYAGVR
jgi:hypothetical protein